ncbi:MAG: hypothetical protein GY705_25235 [Bacteroidetes bacterium]|nr:hypothetical protein [Bacteroidota bacterium]
MKTTPSSIMLRLKATYVRAAKETGDLKQMRLFNIPGQKVPDHKIALDCWQSKRQKGEECEVRQRGIAGNRKKCQICLDKISLDMFGV